MITIRKTIALLALPLLLTACTPPGEGDKALAGFKASTAIVQALGEYHSKNGAYPDTLEALAPTFLTSARLAPPASVAGYEYSRKGADYTFVFKYHGPGTNRCTFESASRAWDCSGHF